MRSVFVTGMGIISALGENKNQNLSALKAEKSGIDHAKYLQSKYANQLYFGEVRYSDVNLREKLAVDDQSLTRTTLLALKAVREAIEDANLAQEEYTSFRTGFISSSTIGGMCYTDELYNDANLKGDPSIYNKSYTPSEHTFRIKDLLGIKGYTTTINTACSSSANAIMLGARLIKAGKLDRVIVGGADTLAKYSTNGFNSLMILSDEPCQPFDVNRKGLNLGEGAAYLVLEADDIAQSKKKYAKVAGYGNSNDAYHPSTTSPEAFGPTNAMREALAIDGIEASSIDCINAHGTGTVNNDETELAAFKTIFGSTIPSYSSTKSFTGHTLAAAGSLEAVFSIFSLLENEVYPSLRISKPLDEAFPPVLSLTQKEIKRIMSNSFGFGGNCTSLIFEK